MRKVYETNIFHEKLNNMFCGDGWVVQISKIIWLGNIDFLIQITIQEGDLDIHMIEFELEMTDQGKQQSYNFESGNWTKGFIIIDSFILSVTMGSKSCYVASNVSFRIWLIFENPIGSKYVGIRGPRNQNIS